MRYALNAALIASAMFYFYSGSIGGGRTLPLGKAARWTG
jgi:hypothetical protein